MRLKTVLIRKNVLLLVTLVIIAAIQSVSSKEVAKFAYKLAPENLSNHTLRVDGDMVAMSEDIYAQLASNSSDTLVDTPSIFFIIDNSGSMVNNPGTDRNGNRFTVTSALLDTLFNNYPGVEVGLSIFGSTLYFDPADKPYFVSCPTQQGAYVPLLQLNQNYPIYGNKTGYAILKEILATNNGALSYTPSSSTFGSTGTNITAGFDAAKFAFRSSLNVANHEKQFVIFLSDGMANVPDSTNNRAETFRFARGDSIPTTFTVFFSTTTPPTYPSRIDTMTTNIRNNGWSQNNLSSDKWGYQNTTQTALMNFLMENVLTVITTNSKVTPKSVSINGLTANQWVNGKFTLPSLFPLTGAATLFNYSVTYAITKNSVVIKDTVHSISNLNVQIDPARALPADSFEVKHWDRNLNLRSNGAAVVSVTETMDELELVFDFNPGTALYNYSNVKVQVSNQLGAIRDNETYSLVKGTTNLYSIKFKRAKAPVPVSNNGIFEQIGLPGDSLIAVFRNSETTALPLDTLRIAFPMYVAKLTSVISAVTGDLDGNGYIDNIKLTFDQNVKLTDANIASFLIRSNGTVFTIDTIINNGAGDSSTTWTLVLKEVKTLVPQTSWTPDVSITYIAGVQPVVNFKTTDNCPPVVWKAEKVNVDASHNFDTVKIYLSEKIIGGNGGAFDYANTRPDAILNVWDSTSKVLVNGLLNGINGFYSMIGDSVLVFITNGNDLSTSNFVNLRTQDSLISDASKNFPKDPNQKVRISISGVTFNIFTGPNPARPSMIYPDQIQFVHTNNIGAVIQRANGTSISLRNLTRPINPDDAKKVKGVLKVIDVVGNTVNWCKTDDLFSSVNDGGGSNPLMDI